MDRFNRLGMSLATGIVLYEKCTVLLPATATSSVCTYTLSLVPSLSDQSPGGQCNPWGRLFGAVALSAK